MLFFIKGQDPQFPQHLILHGGVVHVRGAATLGRAVQAHGSARHRLQIGGQALDFLRIGPGFDQEVHQLWGFDLLQVPGIVPRLAPAADPQGEEIAYHLLQARPEGPFPGLHPILDGRHQGGQFLLLLAPPLATEIVGTVQGQGMHPVGVDPGKAGQHPSADAIALGMLAKVHVHYTSLSKGLPKGSRVTPLDACLSDEQNRSVSHSRFAQVLSQKDIY